MTSPSCEVISPGLLTSLQDLGRPRYQRYAVPTSGAADTYSARVANLLVGNPPNLTTMEVTLLGPTLRMLRDCTLSFCGAAFEILLGGGKMECWQTFRVRNGQMVTVGPATSGARGYLAISGGWDCEITLGSRSTCLSAGFGGYAGRALQAGDVVLANDEMGDRSLGRRLATDMIPSMPSAADISDVRVIAAPFEAHWFAADPMEALVSSCYTATNRQDRMGVRLDGPKIATAADAGARPSEGVVAGAIQTPPDGFPIVLMADRQTTGGYPVAGVVATVDISTVAQAAPGARLQFVQVTAEEARALLCRRERFLRQLEAVAIAPESVGTSEEGDAF